MDNQVYVDALKWDGIQNKLSMLWIVAGVITGLLYGAHEALPHIARIKFKCDEKRDLEREGIRDKVWLMTPAQLDKEKFNKTDLGDGLALFQRTPEAGEDKPLTVEAVIKDGPQTVGFAEIVALDHKVPWSYSKSDTVFFDNKDVPLDEYVKDSSIPKHLAERSQDPLDVVAIGLASGAGRGLPIEPKPPTKHIVSEEPTLAFRRALSLGTAFRKYVDFVKTRPVNYWTLDLGPAKTATARDEEAEKRQRAAILVALTRRAEIPKPLSAEKALGVITTNVTVYDTDLRDFKNSANPGPTLKKLP